MRRWIVVPLAVAALVLVASPLAAQSAAKVVLHATSLGKVLADARGRTVYLFQADKAGKSVCYGACAATWPPFLTVGLPSAGAGVKPALLGTTKRKDGKLQVTYARHPLYFFVQDKKAGQTNGEGINHFDAVTAAGKAAKGSNTAYTPPPAGTTTTTTTTTPYPGGGYGP